MPLRLRHDSPSFEADLDAFIAARAGDDAVVRDVVADIIATVRRDGDAALAAYTKRFEGLDLTPGAMALGEEAVDEAASGCPADVKAALRTAADRIEAYHRHLLPEDFRYDDGAGFQLGARWTPVAAAGLYVPGGTAAYPSSVLMNAIPAQVAGVERLVMMVPMPGGTLNPAVMAAAQVLGIQEIYPIGGAQAVAALAYGTESVVPVDKIVGPGNAYVAEAKRQVFGTVGIDMIAGPSEILVIADGANDPSWIAADLLSQAEHDTNAQAILLTDDAAFGDAVAAAVELHLKTLARAAIAAESWKKYGAIAVVRDIDQAAAIANRIAPEHLELAVEDPEALALKIRNAGALFLGRHAPEAIGDYIAGPNHVLPTYRSARFSSGLGVLDFMKRTSIISCGAQGLSSVGPAAAILAQAEGLDAHALSVTIRLNGPNAPRAKSG
jgi:histidinol dehydrogenase